GLAITVLGSLIMGLVIARIQLFGRAFDLHAEVAGALLVIIGVQIVALGLCAHAYGAYFMGERDPWFDRMRSRYRLEHGLALGGGVAFAGFAIGASIVGIWIGRGLGALSEE